MYKRHMMSAVYQENVTVLRLNYYNVTLPNVRDTPCTLRTHTEISIFRFSMIVRTAVRNKTLIACKTSRRIWYIYNNNIIIQTCTVCRVKNTCCRFALKTNHNIYHTSDRSRTNVSNIRMYIICIMYVYMYVCMYVSMYVYMMCMK